MRLYDLLEKDGWANHYNCDMTDGECNKRIAERESAEHIEKTLREQIARDVRGLVRHEYEQVGSGYMANWEMVKRDDGDYVLFDDVIDAIARGEK